LAGGVVEAAQAIQGLELSVAVTDLPGDVDDLHVGSGGLVVSALEPVDVAEADECVQFTDAIAGGVGDVKGSCVLVGRLLVAALQPVDTRKAEQRIGACQGF
jgi:hypothetical protein